MLQIPLFVVLIGAAASSRLDSQYLPPSFGYSAYAGGQSQVAISRYDNTNDGSGNYNYAYSAGNGINVQEQGHLRNAGGGNEAETVQGSYSYTAPNGQQITVTYTADENGFHPQGAHLPTPPPIPDAILRSLSPAAQHYGGGGGGYDDGQYRPGSYSNNGGYRY